VTGPADGQRLHQLAVGLGIAEVVEAPSVSHFSGWQDPDAERQAWEKIETLYGLPVKFEARLRHESRTLRVSSQIGGPTGCRLRSFGRVLDARPRPGVRRRSCLLGCEAPVGTHGSCRAGLRDAVPLPVPVRRRAGGAGRRCPYRLRAGGGWVAAAGVPGVAVRGVWGLGVVAAARRWRAQVRARARAGRGMFPTWRGRYGSGANRCRRKSSTRQFQHGIEPHALDWHVEAVHGCEPHDRGYAEAVELAARCMLAGGCD
jgi:hypothetical protein